MIRLLIYGTGEMAKRFLKIMDTEKVEIINFIETNPSKSNFNGIKIISYKEICTVDYDYLVICSMYYDEILLNLKENSICNSNCIIFNDKHIKCYSDELVFNKKIEIYKENAKEIKVIVSGLSYARDAVDPNHFNGKAMNFSNSGQDLRADYYILKKLLNMRNDFNGDTTVILGIGLYSFHYDLSKTKNNMWNSRYFGISSYFEEIFEDLFYKCFREFAEKYLLSKKLIDENEFYYRSYKECYFNNIPYSLEEGEAMAVRHSKMINYTLSENVIYFKKIAKMCSEKNLNLIVYVFPTTEYYYKYLSLELKESFHKTIKNLKLNCHFILKNYLQDSRFIKEDFWDTSHISQQGALKVSKLIKRDLRVLLNKTID